MEFLVQVIFIGVVATMAIDIWAVILNKGFKLPTTNWGMVGRWFGHLPSGKYIHSPISSSEKIRFEHAIGWGLHYAIGIVYAYLYLLVVFYVVKDEPSLITAMTFGLLTVLVPWLVLQPGLGLGFFAKLTDKPSTVRVINLSMHAIFGVALYFGWVSSLTFISTR